jgi:RNA polymerase sigma-70 factor (ECF subfamily)
MVGLHELLLQVTTAEAHRRGARFRLFGPELEDLAQQAAADATLAVCGRIGSFRGESRFTTWAYKFAIFDLSAKLGRHFWRDAGVSDEPDWDALPDRLGGYPGAAAEGRELLDALREGVEQVLTERQRRIFVALALNGIPLDAVVARYDSNRNAIYKTMFDARRKLRAHLVACELLEDDRVTSKGGDGRVTQR